MVSEGSPPVSRRLTILTSACLLGHKVRYNGAAKTLDWLLESLAGHVEFMPLCPEVAMGLGVPRPTLQLRQGPQGVRLISRDGSDHTEQAYKVSDELCSKLNREPDAIILTSGSPSCGPRMVKIYDANGVPTKTAVGLFAATVSARYPMTPLIESGRLLNQALRERFLLTAYTLRRFKDLEHRIAALQRFHRQHKFLLRMFDLPQFVGLGQIIAAATPATVEATFTAYHTALCKLMSSKLRRPLIADALVHMYGFMKTHLAANHKRQILDTITSYEKGLVGLASPLALIEFIANLYEVTYIQEQVIFAPYPKELGICDSL